MKFPSHQARERLLPGFFLGRALASHGVRAVAIIVLALLGSADRAAATDDQTRPYWSFRFAPCNDDTVAGLVGRRVDDALTQVRGMRLMAVRVLDRWTAVNYEVVPERLTMVVHDNGVVVRAFCR